MLKIVAKPFSAVTVEELYAILQLRSEVFVIEQECIYQDLDGKDTRAIHVIGYYNDVFVAYLRCFPSNAYFIDASIGRVVVRKEYRKLKFGYAMLNFAKKYIHEHFKTRTIKISAQAHLSKFYEKIGFQSKGELYLEDGIPHVCMFCEIH